LLTGIAERAESLCNCFREQSVLAMIEADTGFA